VPCHWRPHRSHLARKRSDLDNFAGLTVPISLKMFDRDPGRTTTTRRALGAFSFCRNLDSWLGCPTYQKRLVVFALATLGLTLGVLIGCSKPNTTSEAPPPAEVDHESDAGAIRVEHPERFPLVVTAENQSAATLSATGVVAPDVSRQVPVISLASGRVVDIRARLGDRVKKGEILMRVRSADIAVAFSDHRKAVADEALARTQFERAKSLFNKGAISQNDFQVAQDAAQKARVDLETTEERLKVLGAGTEQPSGFVNIYAPVSGVITDQQVTLSSGVQALAAPNPFTISDLSHVWIVCDIYENDLSFVQLGEYADVRLNAYPDRAFKGRISNIAPILDPSLRTAKVRLEVPNPGLMRIGMFVTATFHGKKQERHATVPATAILHLHDRNWVYVPLEGGQFRRVEVTAGAILHGNTQEIIAGISPGQKVVANALVLQNAMEQ
jgi:cobalt-zinc-cadmium efflux system membrane fusion protein